MQRNSMMDGRPRSFTHPSIPLTSNSKHSTKAKGGNEDDIDRSSSTRSTGYCDDSLVKLANQSEEQNLVGVMDRLRAAKSRAKVDRNQQTMQLRKDCWILESQRKAMLNSTVAFSDLLKSTRLKNARAAAQAGDAENASGTKTPNGTPPMSPRLHTKLLRWRGITLDTQEALDESSDGSKTSSTDTENRLPGITQGMPPGQHRERTVISREPAASLRERGRGRQKVVSVPGRKVTTGLALSGNRRSRSQSLRSIRAPPDEPEQRIQPSSKEALLATDSRLQAMTITERALLQRRPRTAAPKLALTSDNNGEDVKGESESADGETESLQDTSSAVGTPPTSRRRARSMSYMALAQNSVSASGKVRAVNEKTISLHGRTTRELRKMAHIDSVAAAESEERRKQIEDMKREKKERERQKLQEKVDSFLKKIEVMTKEEINEKRSLGLTVSF